MSHFDPDGNPHLVDVSAKSATVRVATAAGRVVMNAGAAELTRSGANRKGDVLMVARLAAIQAAKMTERLIPLCHAIAIEAVEVGFEWIEGEPTDPDVSQTRVLECRVTVRTTAKTGVEMEAMSGVSVACLTVYDMLKSVDRGMILGPIRLISKSGGKSGNFRVSDPPADG